MVMVMMSRTVVTTSMVIMRQRRRWRKLVQQPTTTMEWRALVTTGIPSRNQLQHQLYIIMTESPALDIMVMVMVMVTNMVVRVMVTVMEVMVEFIRQLKVAVSRWGRTHFGTRSPSRNSTTLKIF